MPDLVGRFYDDFPDDDPADHAPLAPIDMLALELWRAQEQQAVGEASPMQTLVRLGERSPTFMRRILPHAPNGAATLCEVDLLHLDARLVSLLKFHQRGRAARRRARASRRRARDPHRKRR